MYEVLVAKTAANFGLPATRPVYEKAIEVLPDRQTAEMCLRFAAMERKLGEIDRARAIYAHGSQFAGGFGVIGLQDTSTKGGLLKLGSIPAVHADPRVNPQYWSAWNAFEVETGSEDTFREHLRIKRAVQASVSSNAGISLTYCATAHFCRVSLPPQFNTSTGYLAARAAAVKQSTAAAAAAATGDTANATTGAPADAMAALEASNKPSMAFVP